MANIQAPKNTESKNNGNSGTCFTIMPFGGWFDSYYKAIYKPAIAAAGLEPCRADDLYRPSTIVTDIWSYTQSAKLILADLTGKNPNVFYELGLAHALAKPAILVTESMDDVPFDLRALRVLEYDKNIPNWGEILQKKITKSIQELLESPLQAVLPAFLEVKRDAKPIIVSENDKSILELRHEIEQLRRELYSSKTKNKPFSIDPTEIEQFIVDNLRQEVPIERIEMELDNFGVPSHWVGHILTNLTERAEFKDKLIL